MIYKLHKPLCLAILIVVSGFILLPASLSAQKPKQQDDDNKYDKYTILRNDPDHVPNFTLSIHPLAFSLNLINGSGGAAGDVEANYTLNEKFTVFANAALDYYTEYPGNGVPVNKVPGYNFGIGGTWFFYDELIDKDVKEVVLSEQTGARVITNYYIKIPTQARRKIGLRGSFALQNVSMGSPSVSTVTGYDVTDPSKKPVDFSEASFSTNASLGVFSVGIVFEKIRDYLISYARGEDDLKKKNQFYMDLLWEPFVTYGNVKMGPNDSVRVGTYNIDKYSQKSALGARVGINFNSLKKFGGSRSLEFGWLPNVGLYTVFKLGIALSFDVKSNESEKKPDEK